MANEKLLIDVTDALEKLRKAESKMRIVDFLGFKAVDIGSVIQFLESRQTVDAVEVKHGEWIIVIDENDCECIECPLCGEQFYDGDNDTFDKPYNYCPNCGADMRGDGNA